MGSQKSRKARAVRKPVRSTSDGEVERRRTGTEPELRDDAPERGDAVDQVTDESPEQDDVPVFDRADLPSKF